jgi:hypothetical protein
MRFSQGFRERIYLLDTRPADRRGVTMVYRYHRHISGPLLSSGSAPRVATGLSFHAALRPAQENWGKLVTVVKQQVRLVALAGCPEGKEGHDLIIVDGPPGIGCPLESPEERS